jgi:hypothetical protein
MSDELFHSHYAKEFFSFAEHPNWLRGSPGFICKRYQWLFNVTMQQKYEAYH